MSFSTTKIPHAGRSRVRPFAGLAAAAVLTTAGLALPHPVDAAEPAADTGDCARPFTGALTAGLGVNGLTVTQGTTPETFTGTVLGTLKDGIAPGTDMILMELHSDAIDADGIWEGMSGSPVYDDVNHELIGAVSYSLSYGKSNIAGVTPFSAMDKYLPAPAPAAAPARVRFGSQQTLARKVAAAADVTPAQAQEGLSQLRTPLAVAGVPASRVAKAQRSGKPYLRGALATGRMGTHADGVDQDPRSDLQAGGNLAAMMVYGEVAEGGIGTVTSVCNGALVGFGHPMLGEGASTMTMMSADAVTVQPDPLGSAFKVANLGAVAGTITQDRFTGISGPLDGGPAAATFRASARYGADAHTGTSYSAVPEFQPDAAFYQLSASDDAALQAVHKGGTRLTFTVTGTDPAGRPFSISHSDRYASSYDISYDSSYDLGDLVYGLSSLRGVHLTSVTANSNLDDNSDVATISRVQQRVRGTWVNVTGESPLFARPGRRTVLRLVLSTPGAATTYKSVVLSVPKRFKNGRGRLTFVGGNDTYTDFYSVQSVPQAIARVKAMVRNDAISFHEKLRKGPRRINRTVTLSGLNEVVGGGWSIPVIIGRR